MGNEFHLGSSLVAVASGCGLAIVWIAVSRRVRPWVLGAGVVAGVLIAAIGGAPRPVLGLAAALVGWSLAGDDRPEVAGPSMRIVGLLSVVGVWFAVPDRIAAATIGAVLLPLLMIESIAGARFRRGERWVLLAAVAAAVACGADSVPTWAGGLACAGLLVAWSPIGTIGVAVHVVAIAAASRLVARLHPVGAVLAGLGILVGAAVFESLLATAATARRRP